MLACLPPPGSSASLHGNRHAGSVSPAPSVCSDVSEISLDFQLQEKPELKLSLDDINLALDQERSRSQQQSRCDAVKAAQTRMLKIYARARQNRHGPTDSMSLPSFSRPQTRAESYDGEPLRAKSAVTLPAASTERFGRTRPGSKICLRVQSSLSENPAGDPSVSSLCRQCCEVLGPRACHQCAKIQRRQRDMRRFEKAYPGLLDTDDEVTTAIVVKKYMPAMETDHIQNLMAQGHISAPNFRETLMRLKEEARRKAIEAENKRNAIQKAANKGRGTYTFFSSIRDLNQKIVSGRVSKKVGWGTAIGGVSGPPGLANKDANNSSSRADKKMSFTELICPMFISPKRLKSEPPGFVAHYEPPLLPKVCQNVEPAFFAGCETPYKLPDRLPEKPLDTDESS